MKRNFGVIIIFLLAACGSGHDKNTSTDIENTANPAPLTIPYRVVNIYPHDSSTYTEGLEWHDSSLYESGGDPDYKGKSKLVRTDLKTGKVLQKLGLSSAYFGEGITLLDGKIYQMTYKEQKCFVYDAKTFQLLKTFTYSGEGWGMTNDGKEIIMDDGSNHLFYRNPQNFAVTRTVDVVDNYGPVANINELEYVNGFIYANIYESNTIIKIDPTTGRVVGKMDLTGIREKNGVPSDPEMMDDGYVLNGIAYDSVKNSFYVTGKDWPVIFELKLN